MLRRGLHGITVVLLLSQASLSWAQEKKSTGKNEQAGAVTVNAGDVTYVVSKSSVGADGQKWTLVLDATSKNGDKKIMIQSIRAITAEGKTLEIKSPMGRKAISLPEDTKIQIELNMGDLARNVKSLSRIELYGDRVTGIPGFEMERKGAFGAKKAEKVENRPLVLRNVPVTRSE